MRKTKTANRTKLFSNSRGQSAAEFAIVLPIILLLILNSIEWGFVLWAQSSYENAVRDGARAGVVIRDWDTKYTERSDELRVIVTDRLSSLPASLRENISSRINVEIIDDATGQVRSVRVSIGNQPYTPITGFPGVLVPSALSAKAEFRYEGGT